MIDIEHGGLNPFYDEKCIIIAERQYESIRRRKTDILDLHLAMK